MKDVLVLYINQIIFFDTVLKFKDPQRVDIHKA